MNATLRSLLAEIAPNPTLHGAGAAETGEEDGTPMPAPTWAPGTEAVEPSRAVPMRREGGCLCGAVRFTVEGEPTRIGICHCLDCRKATGSVFAAFAVWPRSAYAATGETSTFKDRSFCPACGSRVTSLTADEAEVSIGTLDDAPTDLIPSYELWVGRREGWLSNLPWADQHEGDRTEHGGNWRQAFTDR